MNQENFLQKKNIVKKLLKKELQILNKNKIDVVTLSSTHLPFLKKYLEKEFPNVEFIDPGNIVAQKIFSKIKNKQSKKNSLKIFTSKNTKNFQAKLLKIGIKNKVNFLSFDFL